MRASAESAAGIAAVIVRPATIERFGDIEPVINRACWCQYWRQTAAEYGPSTYCVDHSNWDRRREALRAQCAVEPVAGVNAYLGDLPMGWCGFGPRSSMKRLEGSRTIPKIDDVPVWSIVCFDVVRTVVITGGSATVTAQAEGWAISVIPSLWGRPASATASVASTFDWSFHLIRSDGEWRIDRLDGNYAPGNEP